MTKTRKLSFEGKTERVQEPLQTRPWRLCLQRELVPVQRGPWCLWTSYHTRTGNLPPVCCSSGSHSNVNEKGRLADAGWLSPLLSPLLLVVRDEWMVFHDSVGFVAWLFYLCIINVFIRFILDILHIFYLIVS